MPFKKGNPGKPKGAISGNNKLIKEVFVDAFNNLQEGTNNLTAWAENNPDEFYKLAMRIIPTQIQISANVNITDEPVTFE